MTFPALPDLAFPHDDLSAVRHRLMAVRASLQKACDELDAQIEALADLTLPGSMPLTAVAKSAPSLFETEPVPPLPQTVSAPVKNPVASPWSQVTHTSLVLEAKGPMSVDPDMEQATLEELNKALTKAFSQISHRHPWAG